MSKENEIFALYNFKNTNYCLIVFEYFAINLNFLVNIWFTNFFVLSKILSLLLTVYFNTCEKYTTKIIKEIFLLTLKWLAKQNKAIQTFYWNHNKFIGSIGKNDFYDIRSSYWWIWHFCHFLNISQKICRFST